MSLFCSRFNHNITAQFCLDDFFLSLWSQSVTGKGNHCVWFFDDSLFFSPQVGHDSGADRHFIMLVSLYRVGV